VSSRGRYPLTCACGASFEADLWDSLNVTLDPDLKEQLLAGKVNVVTCPECGAEAFVEKDLLYHDLERRIMILMVPEQRRGEEDLVREQWETTQQRIFGATPGDDPEALRLRTAIVFGLAELVQAVAELEFSEPEGSWN
jgi:hypothetical protein